VDTAGPAWSIVISEKFCEVRNLSLWPQVQISGIVVDVTGAPVSDMTVQAFAFDRRGERGIQAASNRENTHGRGDM
jgi:hypothetical protein